VSGDLFDRLDAELAALTRRGAHLTTADRAHRRWALLLRRGLLSAVVILALAATLVSEFPATASGHGWAAQSQKGEQL
jgi:hypothetical protein